GIKKLLDSGIVVVVGVLENECTELNRRFFTFMQKKRPYIILKWAESADGFIAPEKRLEQKPVWITNSLSRQLVHKWRSEEHAILVGTQTVLDDNPELTVREWSGNNPIRVVLDYSSRADKNSLIFNDEAKTILITGTSQFPELSQNVIIEKVKEIDVKTILEVLYKHAITSVIVEGGSRTLQSFIDENLWDEARVFLGNKMFGSGIKAPQFKHAASDLKLIGEDRLSVYKNCAE
ncbi:MAG TPA: dihydrofolate reductase family protein, partial [Flavobacterium sp.]